jgi:hypothetical protein
MLILALDANFRLKNRLRANEHQDPSLGPGLGYFVEAEPYKKHLRNYVAEKDVRVDLVFYTQAKDDDRSVPVSPSPHFCKRIRALRRVCECPE